MNRTDAPKKQAVPFAVNGQREDLLPTSPAGDNTASYDAGFPAVTMILKAAGGLPPKGQDMNQILFELASIARWASAGAGYAYDTAFSTTVGGYPVGAKILSTDGAGYWLNTSEANSVNPEVTNGSLTGWVPSAFYGTTSITGLTAANVTLTSLQAARDRIELSGVLTANINIIVPAWRKSWTVVNNCTGSFSVTVKTPSGAGISIGTGKKSTVYGDSVNVTDQGYLLSSNNLSEIAAAGSAAQLATRNNISVYSRAEVDGKVIGVGQTWVGYNSTQRVVNTVYTNDTGRPIMVTITSGTAAISRLIVDGVTTSNVLVTGASGGNLLIGSLVVPAGSTYQFTSSTAAVAWAELR